MSEQTQMTNGQIVTNGVIGAGASVSAWAVAHVNVVNSFLQTGCLCLGLLVSAVTLGRLISKGKTK